jgi:hypothetical protein
VRSRFKSLYTHPVLLKILLNYLFFLNMFKLKYECYTNLNLVSIKELRLYQYTKYKRSLGFIKKNLFFINISFLIHEIFYGFKFKTLKISQNLYRLNLNLILAYFCIKLVDMPLLKFIKKKINIKLFKNLKKLSKIVLLNPIKNLCFFFF